jgi:LAGLIDADG DNA endonuclease family
MDDGNKHRTHFYLNTDSFSLDDTLLLIKVLKENFDLNCSYHIKRKGQNTVSVF